MARSRYFGGRVRRWRWRRRARWVGRLAGGRRRRSLAPAGVEILQIDSAGVGVIVIVEDLRAAAAIVDGRRVAGSVRALVVPGSAEVKRQAEAEGLDAVFERAGFEWRQTGCSMCLGMNPDILQPGERCASTSNRNFEGRQGAGGRTHLLSPTMAAAARSFWVSWRRLLTDSDRSPARSRRRRAVAGS